VRVKVRSSGMRKERTLGEGQESGVLVPSSRSRGRDTLHDSTESPGRDAAQSASNGPTADNTGMAIESSWKRFLQRHPVQSHVRENVSKPLRVMKFGGTSVGDASCMAKVAEIVRAALRDNDVVVVVSAMGGVTNKLIEAATHSEAGDRKPVATIFEELRKRHDAVVNTLSSTAAERTRIGHKMQEIFEEGQRLCEGTVLLRELTPRVRDSISSLGERLSAPLVAAALAEHGVVSEAIDATELVVTDSDYGAADPRMNLTRERCHARLRPLLQQSIVPVVTGFIGATAEGVLTTLGRGGSDYSATILGAALDADEVIIWTDVDGLLTADPRLVPGACTVPEISYREAAELAHFGAKVLHPKTLRAVMRCGIPLWIRNTFAPEKPGTKITPMGPPSGGGVKALTAIGDVALITVGGPGIVGVPDVLGRTFATTAAVRADVLLISQSSSQNNICLIVSSSSAKHTVEALRHEFAQDLAHEKVEHITLDPNVAIVTVVGQNMRGISGIVGRTFGALGREDVNIIAIAQGSSECNISFVVAQKDMRTALVTTHREFELGHAEVASAFV
jgi:aspartokinase/homoserine dehydrogenase 1